MEPNYSKIFNKKTIQSVLSFCELNKIDDTDKFFKKCFQSGFNIEKYGFLGNSLNDEEKHLKTDGIGEKHTEIEVIVEKRVEVPVEVIREVEKIVEVIKEVPVEKIVTKIEYISDKTTENELGGIITKLEEEMSKKDEELNKVRQSLDEHLSKPPIEIIKEVEVIKEVDNNEKLKMMGETLQKLRKELSLKDKKIEELEGINKQLESIKVSQGAVYLKGSNITQKL
jgi:hypothetical protein